MAVSLLAVGGGAAWAVGGGGSAAQVQPLKAATTEDGTAGQMVYRTRFFDNPSGSESGGIAKCPKGKHPTGGGYRLSDPDGGQVVRKNGGYDGPDADLVPDDGWEVLVKNLTMGDASFAVNVVCHA